MEDNAKTNAIIPRKEKLSSVVSQEQGRESVKKWVESSFGRVIGDKVPDLIEQIDESVGIVSEAPPVQAKALWGDSVEVLEELDEEQIFKQKDNPAEEEGVILKKDDGINTYDLKEVLPSMQTGVEATDGTNSFKEAENAMEVSDDNSRLLEEKIPEVVEDDQLSRVIAPPKANISIEAADSVRAPSYYR
ncbi:hypothetical protein K7X08_036592 [Anisodus acutangulus]|uniref:Uncharacterized protein n=1 Tax=Anisodus acutangulus TaxID=402998 RepID=A0A9Q1L6B5_9SOLA|nr:hypothetical protein K7X08_036592 [Anisodus acutangulus]